MIANLWDKFEKQQLCSINDDSLKWRSSAFMVLNFKVLVSPFDMQDAKGNMVETFDVISWEKPIQMIPTRWVVQSKVRLFLLLPDVFFLKCHRPCIACCNGCPSGGHWLDWCHLAKGTWPKWTGSEDKGEKTIKLVTLDLLKYPKMFRPLISKPAKVNLQEGTWMYRAYVPSRSKPNVFYKYIYIHMFWIHDTYIWKVWGVWIADPLGRKLPVVLPHKIVGQSFWPRIASHDIKQYWDHLKKVGSPLASVSPQGNHIPCWIWGDEAQWRENGDEICLICMGCCIDHRKFSVQSCFPISLCRSDS